MTIRVIAVLCVSILTLGAFNPKSELDVTLEGVEISAGGACRAREMLKASGFKNDTAACGQSTGGAKATSDVVERERIERLRYGG